MSGQANGVEQMDPGFPKVDMAFLVRDQILEKDLADIITHRVAMLARPDTEGAGIVFAGQIRLVRFAQILSDPQRVRFLQIGMSFQKDDSLDQAVGVVHLFDGFRAGPVGDASIAPVPLQAIVQPVRLTAVISGRSAAFRRSMTCAFSFMVGPFLNIGSPPRRMGGWTPGLDDPRMVSGNSVMPPPHSACFPSA